MVVCGRRRAYVERTDRAFLDNVDPYYASLVEVDDLLAVDDDPVKIAVFTPGDPEAAHRARPGAVHRGAAGRRVSGRTGST